MKFKKLKDYIIFILFIIIIVSLFYIFILQSEIKIIKKDDINNITKIKRNFFGDNFHLKDYQKADFQITEEGKKIILNIRKLKSTPSLIDKENRDKELCAGYIWTLTEKIWGHMSPYYIGMMNMKTKTPAKAWELPSYYVFLGGKNMIDFTGKFLLEEKDLYDKVSKKELRNFFLEAFTEQALFGDIGFLYKNTKYIGFLDGWSANSHIAKNIGITKFSVIVKDDNYDFGELLGCNKDVYNKLKYILGNYKFWLNSKRIIFYNKDFYYINSNNEILKKVKFKFGDNITYKDIVITHFYDKKSRVDSLFNFICKGEFLPINITGINPRFIEKM